MRARDLMEDFPLVSRGTDALEATRLLVARGLPGLVVLDEAGVPLVVLPDSQVLRFALPEYVEDDPTLADVFPEAEADRLCEGLAGRTVAELMPGKAYLPKRDRDRPIVAPRATVMQIASVMSRQKSPIVAVVDAGAVLGVITVHRLLGARAPARMTDPNGFVIAAAITVFVGAYVLIATEWVHRVRAALGGAAVMFLIGATTGDEAFFSAETGVDWNVVLLLFGMMVVISVVKQTGLFDYLAIWAAKRAKGRPYRLLVLLCLITAGASALLDNVTTVLLMAPVTLLVCDRLGARPEMFLIAEALVSNIGGVGTLIGDPPNIIIGSRAPLSFNDFLVNLAPLAVLLVAVFLLLARFLFRKAYTVDAAKAENVMALDERQALGDPAHAAPGARRAGPDHRRVHGAQLPQPRTGGGGAARRRGDDPGQPHQQRGIPAGRRVGNPGLLHRPVRHGRRAGQHRRHRLARRAGGRRRRWPVPARRHRPAVRLRGDLRGHRQHPLRRHHDPARRRHWWPAAAARKPSRCGGRWPWAPAWAATPPRSGPAPTWWSPASPPAKDTPSPSRRSPATAWSSPPSPF